MKGLNVSSSSTKSAHEASSQDGPNDTSILGTVSIMAQLWRELNGNCRGNRNRSQAKPCRVSATSSKTALGNAGGALAFNRGSHHRGPTASSNGEEPLVLNDFNHLKARRNKQLPKSRLRVIKKVVLRL